MNYSLLIYQSADDFAARTDPAKQEAFWGSFLPYMHALRSAGIVVAGAGLETPETATTVRIQEGRRQVQDGPYAEMKEQLGGFFIIDVPDRETALKWAAKCPTGPVEVRACLPPMPQK